jgi:hypothetical protein
MIEQRAVSAQLMEHVRILCQEIGARPAGSRAEQRAAEYVRQQLWALGIEDVVEQPFETPGSPGYGLIPPLLSAAMAVPLGRLGRLGKLMGALTLLGALYNLREFGLAKSPLHQALAATVHSQNVIARIPPRGETTKRVFILAHLDSSRQRFTVPQPFPPLTRFINTLALALGVLGALSMLRDVLTGRKAASAVQKAAGVVALGMLTAAVIDENQPYVEGANDNASAVAAALELASALKAEPLEHSEVTLLFSGSEETACVGIEKYLEQYAPPKQDTYWIDLEMVGAGGLCYVTRHGLSKFGEYHPTPQITALAARTARKHPELRVKGKPMTILDAVAPLVRHGYEAICIAGYDELGALPNWHRLSDTFDRIEPETLSRAHQYTAALVREIDQKDR